MLHNNMKRLDVLLIEVKSHNSPNAKFYVQIHANKKEQAL